MTALTVPDVALRGHGTAGFATAVIRALTWRALLAVQVVAGLLALTSWLTSGGSPTVGLLVRLLCAQALTAMLVLLAALVADEAVRRGSGISRAFVIAILSVSILNVAVQWILHVAFNDIGGTQRIVVVVNDFMSVAAIWGIVLLIHLNRQSATRVLARLREDELARVQAEHLSATSRLREIQACMDLTEVLRQLAEIRHLYASGRNSADSSLENLITTLQTNLAHAVVPRTPGPVPGNIRP